MGPAGFLIRMVWKQRRCRSFGTSWSRRISAAGSVFLALVVAGCASPALKVENVKHIKRIAVAGPENPARYQLYDVEIGTAIFMGMLLGPGAAAGTGAQPDGSTRQGDPFTTALAERGFRLGDELKAELEKTFGSFGFEMASASVERKRTDRLLPDYKGVQIDADALLDVAIRTAQYRSYKLTNWLAPSLDVAVRLVDVKTAQPVFERTYLYDYKLVREFSTHLMPPAEFKLPSREYVLAHPEIAVEAYRMAVRMIASDLRSELLNIGGSSGVPEHATGDYPALCPVEGSVMTVLKLCSEASN